jgi:hypothetical protein
MTDLTSFLLARIAEDEANASVAMVDIPMGNGTIKMVPGQPKPADVRVLADCDSKRRIIAAAGDYLSDWTGGDSGDWAFDQVLRLLALPYSDHVDYDGSWAI